MACYCGRAGCIETWISGTGLEADHLRATGVALKGAEIVAKSAAGDRDATASLERYEDRLARFGRQGLRHAESSRETSTMRRCGGSARVD